MLTKYTVIPPEGPKTVVEVDIPEEPDFDWFETNIMPLIGGWIERVRVEYEGKVTDMLVDEEGLLKGKPLNPGATVLYRGTPARHDGIIVGTAVVFDRPVWF